MQLTYGQQPSLAKGMIADGSDRTIDSYVNELLAQVTTVALAGVTDDAGDYTITITGPDGEVFEHTHTSPGSETSATIATELGDLFEADEEFMAAFSIADNTTGTLTFTARHSGREYVVEAAVEAGTATITNTQNAGGASIGLGLAVQGGSADNLCAVLDAATVDADLLGIAVKSLDGSINGMDGEATAFGPGKTVSVMKKGRAVVPVEGAVTKGGDVYVRTKAGTATNPLGGFRADDDTGNAIQMTGAKFHTSTTGRGLAVVSINRA